MVRFGVVGAVSLVHFRCKRLVSHAIIASDGVETNLTLIDAAIFINLLEMYHGFSRCKACFIPFTAAPADLIVNMDLTRIADGKGTVAFIIAGKCRRRTSGEADGLAARQTTAKRMAAANFLMQFLKRDMTVRLRMETWQ